MRYGPFSAQDFGAISTLGMEFAVAVALGVGAGYGLDRHFACAPWATVGGVLVGFGLGLYILIKEAKRMEKQKTAFKNKK